MKRLNQTVIAASTASLVILGLAGTRAKADNIAPLKRDRQVVRHIAPPVNELDQIRRKVRAREENDGGCG